MCGMGVHGASMPQWRVVIPPGSLGQFKYRTRSGKHCVLAAQSEHFLAVCVHDTVLPLFFFSNSGEALIVQLSH
jgi:hypothetical protein